MHSFSIAGTTITPGQRISLKVPVGKRYTDAEVFLPTSVLCGKEAGPRLFVSAAIHGDEINGVEIVRRLIRLPLLKRLRGALIAVPIVNVYGFLNQQRYLPDRRDLNRTFPGSPKGSLAARLADRFMQEIVANATHGIDLHTGSLHRTNLPHIRACLDDEKTAALAKAFGTPAILAANVRDGSLRQAVLERQMPMLLFEGGEALRFDETVIRAGLRGIVAVMQDLGMLPPPHKPRTRLEPFIAQSSTWVRAPESGILHSGKPLGASVKKGDVLGQLSDPLGEDQVSIVSSANGVVIGRTNLPLANAGDALFHIARFDRPGSAAAQLAAFQIDLENP